MVLVLFVCSVLAAIVKLVSRQGKRTESRFKTKRGVHVASKDDFVPQTLPQLQHEVDEKLSNRRIDLDPAGYFVIRVQKAGTESCIIADFYTNIINTDGFACNPDTGEVIPCGKYDRAPTRVFRGKSAKELSVQILEGPDSSQFCTHLEHANYLGREFQKAECALLWSFQYVQD